MSQIKWDDPKVVAMVARYPDEIPSINELGRQLSKLTNTEITGPSVAYQLRKQGRIPQPVQRTIRLRKPSPDKFPSYGRLQKRTISMIKKAQGEDVEVEPSKRRSSKKSPGDLDTSLPPPQRKLLYVSKLDTGGTPVDKESLLKDGRKILAVIRKRPKRNSAPPALEKQKSTAKKAKLVKCTPNTRNKSYHDAIIKTPKGKRPVKKAKLELTKGDHEYPLPIDEENQEELPPVLEATQAYHAEDTSPGEEIEDLGDTSTAFSTSAVVSEEGETPNSTAISQLSEPGSSGIRIIKRPPTARPIPTHLNRILFAIKQAKAKARDANHCRNCDNRKQWNVISDVAGKTKKSRSTSKTKKKRSGVNSAGTSMDNDHVCLDHTNQGDQSDLKQESIYESPVQSDDDQSSTKKKKQNSYITKSGLPNPNLKRSDVKALPGLTKYLTETIVMIRDPDGTYRKYSHKHTNQNNSALYECLGCKKAKYGPRNVARTMNREPVAPKSGTLKRILKMTDGTVFDNGDPHIDGCVALSNVQLAIEEVTRKEREAVAKTKMKNYEANVRTLNKFVPEVAANYEVEVDELLANLPSFLYRQTGLRRRQQKSDQPPPRTDPFSEDPIPIPPLNENWNCGADVMSGLLILATPTDIRYLASYDTWVIDSTFEVTVDEFKQMMVIHTKINTKFGPVIHALMRHQDTTDYISILEHLIDVAEYHGFALQPANIVCETDRNLQNAIIRCFPDATLFGGSEDRKHFGYSAPDGTLFVGKSYHNRLERLNAPMDGEFAKWLEWMIGLHSTQMHEHVRWLQGLDIRPPRTRKPPRSRRSRVEEPIEIDQDPMIDPIEIEDIEIEED